MTENTNAGQGGTRRPPMPCPICGAPTATLREEVHTSRGAIVITSIACPRCLAAGRTWFWEVGRHNKYMTQK